MIKICSKCEEEKEISKFYKSTSNIDGYQNICMFCHNFRSKLYYLKHKQKIQIDKQIYYKENKNKILIYRNEYVKIKKKEIANYHKNYYLKHKKDLKKYKYEYKKKKLKNNISFKIETNLRRRISSALFEHRKSKPTMKLLGCSIDFLKHYLESQFTEGMSWEKYGLHGWHIDHIKPCALFDLSKPEEQQKCFCYTNLQPLWAIDNLRKGKKYYEITNTSETSTN